MKLKISVIIIILVAFNIFAIIRINNISNENDAFRKKYLELKNQFYDMNGNGELYNPTIHLYSQIEVTENYKSLLSKNNYNLLGIINNYGCFPCNLDEIKNLNKLYSEFPERVHIFFTGEDTSYIKDYSPQFSYIYKSQIDDIFNEKISVSPPVLFIIDPAGMINEIYRPEKESSTKSRIFHKKTFTLINLDNCEK